MACLLLLCVVLCTMAPSEVADAYSIGEKIQREGSEESDRDVLADSSGNGPAKSRSGPARTEGGWSQDTEQTESDMGVAVTAASSGEDQATTSNREIVHITIEFLELTSNSPKVAQALYRTDEAAYRAACGRPHVLLVKRRPLRAPVNAQCAAIMQMGRAMKQQRRGILERLREEYARREYIKWELGVATEKTQSRARRMEAAKAAWNTWYTAKNSKSTQLDAVLASPSGRRLWDEYLQDELSSAANSPAPSPRQQSGKLRNTLSFEVGEPRSTGLPGAQPGGADSPDEKGATWEEKSTTATTRYYTGEHRPGGVANVESSIPQETSFSRDIEESAIVTRGPEEKTTMIDSRFMVAKLHLGLENLSRQGGAGKAGSLDIDACAQFCMEWPRGCELPISFDRALLQPAWSTAAQEVSDRCVGVEALYPAREAARPEAQRHFFGGFLERSEGQAFVIHTIQDGTLEPTEAERFMTGLTMGAHFDEDAYGFRRVVAHGDEWMHSRLVHDGVEQRVRVEAAEPRLVAVQEENARDIATDLGELAAIVQHVYSLAASRLQPFIRGALARRRLPDALWEMFSYASLCAAVEIQRVVRGCFARRRRRQALVSLASISLVRLQARIRGVLLRQRVAKKWAALLDRQASEIQRVFRGYLSRGTAEAVLREKTWARSTDLHGWASLVLQTQARVWLARRIVHLKRVEVGLTSRVSEIADKLASSDDSRSVSAVLGQIDRDYRKYERVISEMKAREEKMATTFVEKVLERRDADISGAWTRFVGAATEFGTDQKKRSEARRAHPHPVRRGERARACEVRDRKLYLIMERYGIPAHAKALSSAYLRASFPMHLKLHGCNPATGVAGDVQLPAAGVEGSTERPTHRQVDHTNKVCMGDGDTSVSHVQSSASGRVAEGSFESSITSMGGGPSTRSPSHTTPVGGQEYDGSVESSPRRWQTKANEDKDGDGGDDYRLGGGDDGGKSSDSESHRNSAGDQTHTSVGGDASRRERCVADSRGEGEDGTSSSRWESMWDAERTSRGLAGDVGSRFPGSSVRQDMPAGMKEVVERLCAAAFLRGHVPDGLMPKGTTPEDAYQRYLNLPPSLAKIRHEQLCTEASRPVASALRSRGYTTLEQLLPVSKLEHLLGQAGAGVAESLAAAALAREIKRRHDTSDRGNDGGGMFSPLSPFSRGGLAGSRRTPNSTEMSGRSGRSGIRDENTGTSSRGSRRTGVAGGEGMLEPKKKKKALRVSLRGLGSGGSAQGADQGSGKWDPSRYTTRPEEWIRPPPSVIKRRWDESAKTFVAVNNYCFDALYRKHHRLDCRRDGDDDHFDGERNMAMRDSDESTWHFEDGRTRDVEGGRRRSSSGVHESGPSDTVPDSLSGPASSGDWYARRVADIMREEYGTFFDGMTQSARELYQHIIHDSASWGSVEDPIGTLLCRAAFHVVEHPSPAAKAELVLGSAKDVASEVPMGLEAFRAFVVQLDATCASRTPSSSPCAPSTARTGRSYRASPVEPCRTLLERRLEAAATLANPFKVRLEADGVSSVRELARVPARAWGLPSNLVEEIERMLSLLVARTCAIQHFRAHRSHKRHRAPDGNTPLKKRDSSPSKGGVVPGMLRRQDKDSSGARRREQKKSFEFDPRFQRSPLDPFGRPPRLERIHPCLGPREEKDGGRHPGHVYRLSADEDDLPPRIWEHATASEDPSGSDCYKTIGVETEVDGATDASFPSVPVESTVVRARNDPRAEDLPVDPRAQELLTHRKPQGRPGQKQRQQQPSHPTAKTKYASGSNTNSPTGTETHPSSTRYYRCRIQPRCGAVFPRASALRLHEKSHASAPEYHRHRRAPQLFRDRPPASSEGAGAAAEKFRLRTTLPPSILRELKLLEGRKASGRRQSGPPAEPDLPAAVAS